MKIFSPLWHKNQETELRELIHYGYKIILSSIAAEGLDKSWLGRELTLNDVDKLVALHKKNGINIAFEGGEAESLVLDAPLFRKEIRIIEAETVMESANTGIYNIKKAVLEDK